jgi:hypothetical protein
MGIRIISVRAVSLQPEKKVRFRDIKIADAFSVNLS